ncbi:hypothetical protein HN682_09925 [Candidatus Peregrinibacteria bacterium]|jgi:hypothetical protein|nr:hypothetical protein [Candidatus Peregrinibacteria bacterium]
MGYTHYFYDNRTRKTQDTKWSTITGQIVDILTDTNLIDLLDNDKEQFQIDKELIMFNGIGDDGHETFYFPRDRNENFNFCKTAHKPYDICVQISLIVLKYYLKSEIDIKSDGENSDWQDANRICKPYLNQSFIMSLDDGLISTDDILVLDTETNN